MNPSHIRSFLSLGLLLFVLLACDDDNGKKTCDTFTPTDSVCFCESHPDDAHCVTYTSFSISLFSEEMVALTPHPSNGTLWCRGFVVDDAIYLIDRESGSPHAFWKFDVTQNENPWTERADFPGVKYGLVGSANGKGYASSYASNKFWEYNPTANEWTPLADLPFSPGETHWVEYNGKFYVPNHDGIYEFTPGTKNWDKISNQTSSGFGALYLIGDDMYWYDINNDFLNRFNLADKSFEIHDLPADFGSNVSFNSPFVIGNTAYVVSSSSLWIFNQTTRTWLLDADAIGEGNAYPDDTFVIDGKVYLVDNGSLKLFEGIPE